MQCSLVQVLVVAGVLGPGDGGEIGIDPVAAVDHRDQLGEPGVVALGQRIGRTRRRRAAEVGGDSGGLRRRDQDINQRRAGQRHAGGEERCGDTRLGKTRGDGDGGIIIMRFPSTAISHYIARLACVSDHDSVKPVHSAAPLAVEARKSSRTP